METVNLRYEIRIVDEDTEEEIHRHSAFSMESFEEDLHKAEKAVAKYIDRLEREKNKENEDES